MHQSLPALLFPEYRRHVLGLLLLRPDEALHGREIARRTGLPSGTITRELGKLAAVGLLTREKRGNQQVYSANTSGPIYSELASILRKTSGLADVLVQALTPVATQLRVAFVFGSLPKVARLRAATSTSCSLATSASGTRSNCCTPRRSCWAER